MDPVGGHALLYKSTEVFLGRIGSLVRLGADGLDGIISLDAL